MLVNADFHSMDVLYLSRVGTQHSCVWLVLSRAKIGANKAFYLAHALKIYEH